MKRSAPFTALYSGFSLVEALISIAILAIIASLAGPSMGTMLKNNNVRSAAKLFHEHLRLAKYESKSVSDQVTFCAVQLNQKTQCVNNNSRAQFRNGWQWFVDLDRDGVYEPPNEILLDNTFEVHSNLIGVRLNTPIRRNRIVFNNGIPTALKPNSTPFNPIITFSDDWDLRPSRTDLSTVTFNSTGNSILSNLH